MRVVYMVPGSGNTFYCQNCFRDLQMVKGLRRLGHDVIMVPMYLPLFESGGDIVAASSPVFYGAVSLYLRHRFPSLRRLPRRWFQWMDAQSVLKMAARRAGSTRARGYEDLTLSMLAGPLGQQADELERLIHWLSSEAHPDVVHLSNALLLGLAGELKHRLGARIVCSLQDEDTWVDAMDEPVANQLWRAMAAQGRVVDRFVAVSRYYADCMQQRLEVADARMRVVPVGIDMEGHAAAPVGEHPPVIGFLSRLAEAEGFGLLVDALMLLKAHAKLGGLKLRATGGSTTDNDALLHDCRRKLAARGWADALEVLPSFDRPARLAFLHGLTVLSVPALKGEAFGTYLLEAMASGVPVVQPRLGGFTEIINDTGGGSLYAPNDAPALAAALEPILLDPTRARALGQRGRASVLATYTIESVAAQMATVYRDALG